MRVVLTDKISTYAPQAVRDRFMRTNRWLGTVVVEGGLRGALMQTDSGYFLVRSANKHFKLNTERTVMAIAEAMAPDAPKRPPGRPRKALEVPRPPMPPGRKALYDSAMVYTGLNAPRWMIDAAREEGRGVVSVGVRKIMAEGMKALGYVVPDERR